MAKRFIAIWFRHLTTDWMIRRHPELKDTAFVLAAPERGRMIVKAASAKAKRHGIQNGMVVADCRATLPSLQVFDDKPDLAEKILKALAEWCLRFTPVAAADLPDGLLLDVSGCPHLWGGEPSYLKDLFTKLTNFGYGVRIALADTPGAAWAVSRFGIKKPIIEPGSHMQALLSLPPAALRLEQNILERLEKLGLRTIESFIYMPRSALRRRFGESMVKRLDQALGQEIEVLQPIHPAHIYEERLPSLEPIRTATGIEIALEQLLEKLCLRLEKEDKGLRSAVFKCYRIDGNMQEIKISTGRPSRNTQHLFKLFTLRIPTIEPALGIEVFTLEAPVVEEMSVVQDSIWHAASDGTAAISELLDRLAGKLGINTMHRYLPAEHYWPEWSAKKAALLPDKAGGNWRVGVPRPLLLLPKPEPIEVSVPIPDYPPLNFRYKNKLHKINKADGPERIEQEWWLQQGLYRDYYYVEDEAGARYWVFRLGHYDNDRPKWFIHGFFA